jgi:hypothetical protein
VLSTAAGAIDDEQKPAHVLLEKLNKTNFPGVDLVVPGNLAFTPASLELVSK